MRAAVLLAAFVAVAAIALLPVVRDELAWWWAESRDHAIDYYTYGNTWQNGLHVAEARLRYKQRLWSEGEKTLIHKAYEDAAHPTPENSVEYNKQKQLRRDAFLWKAATNADTLKAYQDYISQFPQGKFAGPARARIADLSHQAQGQAPAPH
ncbi:MAG TPA: hypothetical protein VGO67_19635 [Verrucomicrobiae bacterium]|jgi:hypothetical protein